MDQIAKALYRDVADLVRFGARVSAIDQDELRELVVDSWRMTVPKKVYAEWLASST